ncbi:MULTISPECIES: helix-turn-helix domain-containing protein [unclassified Bradyrhizobium]|uniref:helix-turn-helix transcriptional regulator n=1 Tax=unclassified Bradyrhizobium TaxID=2631580 RepID=UPI002915CE14|nr:MULTISPECIES: helix-turn-helix domain-containing protein [unclassified Bradyrhizobium]
MADKVSPSPRYLRTPEVARMLGISIRTLDKHRTHGTGPLYRKLGGRIVYTIEDVQAWADVGLRKSTSDRGRGVVHAAKPVPGLGRLAAHRSGGGRVQ